jgi:hypothetical protein
VNAEVRQLRERCSAFDALADALRSPDSWLAYRALAWPDELPEGSRQDTARRSSLERVRAALIDRDEALWHAREDLEKTRTLAANWEAEVATVRVEARELRSSLEGAQAQQRRAEERARELERRAKEADDLKATLDTKAAALVVAEGRLLQESTARQGAEERLQRGQAALTDARAALEQERAAHEVTRKTLADQDAKLSKAEGEVIMLSITNASQETSLREQSETVERLELTVEAVRRDLEMEKKQVEGEPQSGSRLVGFSIGNFAFRFSDLFLALVFPGLRTALGHAAERAEALQASYNSSEQEPRELRDAALETCRTVEEGEA